MSNIKKAVVYIPEAVLTQPGVSAAMKVASIVCGGSTMTYGEGVYEGHKEAVVLLNLCIRRVEYHSGMNAVSGLVDELLHAGESVVLVETFGTQYNFDMYSELGSFYHG